jgi:hypothetical protein
MVNNDAARAQGSPETDSAGPPAWEIDVEMTGMARRLALVSEANR